MPRSLAATVQIRNLLKLLGFDTQADLAQWFGVSPERLGMAKSRGREGTGLSPELLTIAANKGINLNWLVLGIGHPWRVPDEPPPDLTPGELELLEKARKFPNVSALAALISCTELSLEDFQLLEIIVGKMLAAQKKGGKG